MSKQEIFWIVDIIFTISPSELEFVWISSLDVGDHVEVDINTKGGGFLALM